MRFDEDRKRLLGRYVLCLGVLLLSLILFPLLSLLAFRYDALPPVVGEVLFFWPQYLLLPQGVTLDATLGQETYAEDAATYVAAVFWLLALAGYVAATRRLPTLLVAALVLPAVFLVLEAALYVASAALGVGVVLDGP